MYTRSIQNRSDLISRFKHPISLNPDCIPFEYKYIVIKYVPITKTSGRMTMGVNVDLGLNMIPISIV